VDQSDFEPATNPELVESSDSTEERTETPADGDQPADGTGTDSDETEPATDNHTAPSDSATRVAGAGSGPVFRINSPSYQAVQHELEQFLQLRESHAAAAAAAAAAADGILLSFPSSSPRSISLSPDRSPLSLSCGYSPERSFTLGSPPSSSGAASPIYSSSSPPAFDYSPAAVSPPSSPPHSPARDFSPVRYEEETFSDEFDSGEYRYPVPVPVPGATVYSRYCSVTVRSGTAITVFWTQRKHRIPDPAYICIKATVLTNFVCLSRIRIRPLLHPGSGR
jgi:hypothetical protein